MELLRQSVPMDVTGAGREERLVRASPGQLVVRPFRRRTPEHSSRRVSRLVDFWHGWNLSGLSGH
jgi:hypothetical protein